ncbi:uncharacterized protein J8A68_004769 [[Candida] subhashii]|uniref:Calcineurin-like phosphoesterase domain-containing protein n=1 Tax=[Candida] subhashii TaxID=561895 RepID=A0A8J5UK64_9ASCO|nr:uncharacterized protein J8A68_004769 [[Candida] subhashii]KAG7661711.1 hypothetical protein J8A68_004769 [[Candida] subhashii]
MEIRKRNTGIPIKEDPITSEHLDDRDEHRSRRNSINWLYLVVLSLGWVGVVHYFERIVPYRIIEKCQWKQWEKWPSDRDVHRIALLADPQIVDDYSYPKQFKFFNFFVRAGADNYLHRNFQIMQEILDPDTTIFLGDLFDGGRYWEDDQWIAELKRFNKVFPKRVNRRDIRSIPGNHDIGFQTIHKHIQDRFAQYFGDLNDYIELGNHTIVMFDSISLSHPNETILRESREFLESINQRINPAYPRIILTHVPLYRFPDSQLCGPLRESKKLFPLVRGDEYQTVIEYGFSQEILKTIQPEIIFAGDDHDYCDIIQHYQTSNGIDKQTREITMKSPAMTSGRLIVA